ncbi:MAG: hypothetical protein KDA61_20745 [Planctomycetales bacterium]|nr:hypothetical protein [Planctomycetales bacterium]
MIRTANAAKAPSNSAATAAEASVRRRPGESKLAVSGVAVSGDVLADAGLADAVSAVAAGRVAWPPVDWSAGAAIGCGAADVLVVSPGDAELIDHRFE